MDDISFTAEVRSTKSKKLITNDMEYTVTLSGSDPKILSLGYIPGETTIEVNIKIKNE